MLRALVLEVLHWSLLLAPAVGQLAAAWSVTSGQCTLDADGCISSPSYPSSYPDDDSCTIHVPAGNTDAIQVVSFDTESSDKLRVNSIDYSGTAGPDGVVPQGTIGWSSDASSSRTGWKICPREIQTPSRTSPRRTSTRSLATFEWFSFSGGVSGPVGRWRPSGGEDSSGRFWIFGGYVDYDGTWLNDLWYFQHQVDCGEHSAVHCAVCPRDTASGEWYGESWCNGDCSWSAGECQAATTTVEGPGAYLLEGHCNSEVNGRYELQGYTASGRPYYKHLDESWYLFYDPDCDGNPATTETNLGAMWMVRSIPPSTSLEQDLDSDGICYKSAYLESNAELPPTATWKTYCDARVWRDEWLKFSPVGSGGLWKDKSGKSGPSRRSGQSSAMDSSDRFWIFGGWDGRNFFNDLWYFDIQADVWKSPQISGSRPSARYGPASGVSSSGWFWVFGGRRGSDLDLLKDLWHFELEAGWTQIDSGSGPSARFNHAAAVDAWGRFWIFGGMTSDRLVRDLWLFDAEERKWTLASSSSSGPSARQRHSCFLDAAGHFFWVFGGDDGSKLLDDLWYWDLQASDWVQVQAVTDGGPDAREFHASSMSPFGGWVFGGNVPGNGNNDLYYLAVKGHVLPSTTASEVSSTTTTSMTSTTSTSQAWSRTFTSTVSTITTSRPQLQLVEKSPVEIGPAASVQQQEAAAAVQMEDRRQQDAVASVLQVLDLEKLEEVGGFTVDEEGSVTVAAISPRANTSSFRFRAASTGQDFTPDVEIPLSLVADVSTEPLMFAVSVLNQGGADKLQMVDRQPPSTRPLVLSMFNVEGVPLVAASLPEPVLLTLAPDASNDTTCVFWNETLQRWSAEGVTRVQGRGRELVCETTHLSIFAGIEGFLTEVALTFECSNALLLFSREASASLVNSGDWAMQVPSIIFFAILALLLSGVIFALCLDYRSWQRHCATHELQDELHRGVLAKKTDSASGGVVFIHEEVAWKQLLLLNPYHWRLFLDPDSLLLPPLSWTIEKVQAAHLSISTESMVAVIGLAAQTGRKSHAADKSSPGEFHKSAAVAREVKRERDLVRLHNEAADRFLAPGWRGFLYRWAMLAAAFHPLCLLISFCFRISHAARAVLRAGHLLASAAVSVVFYQLTDAVKKECAEELSWTDPRSWVRKLVVFIVSQILSGLLLGSVLLLRSGCNNGESRLRLHLALLQLLIFWLGLVLFIALCVYVVLAFLANMSDKDTSDWVQTWLLSLLWTLGGKPILQGLLVATVFSCALRCAPHLDGKVKEKRQLTQQPLQPLSVLPVAVVKPVDRLHNVQQVSVTSSPASTTLL
ncbi:Lztr1, partial [Symbiodinium sp. CCMP2456]